VTELADRLTRLADAAVADRTLTDPSTAPPEHGPRRRAPWLGAAAALLLVVAVVALAARTRGDEPVTAGPSTTERESPPADPVLSVAFQLVNGDPPLGLRVVVRDEAGETIAERTTAEVEETIGDDPVRVVIRSGLVVDLPGAGGYTVELNGPDTAVTCAVGSVAAGARIVLSVSVDDGPPRCAPATAVEDWAPASTEDGAAYVGLTEAEAETQATADGLRPEVSGRDGVQLPTTRMGLELWLYDGVVVAATGSGEPGSDAPRVREPLAVVVVPVGGVLDVAGDAQIRVGGEAQTRSWPTGVPEVGSSAGTLFADLPAGQGVVEVTGLAGPCTVELDVADEGTVVTVEVEPDGSFPTGECEPIVETLAEHVDRITDGWDTYEAAPEYVSRRESAAYGLAAEEGRSVRIVSRDGLTSALTDDLRPDRLNLVLYDGEVRAAALF
jgi:hypothetical protein